MGVVKTANQVVLGDLVDGAYFNADGDLLEVTDGDIAAYVFRVFGDGSSMEAVDRSQSPVVGRQFSITRADVLDESVPTVSELQTAGYTITAFGAYDEVWVTLGSSRLFTFTYKLDLSGFYVPIIKRLDGFSINAATGDGTAAGVLPDHTAFREGDTVLVTGCTSVEEINYYEKVADIGNGDTGWRSVLPSNSKLVAELSA